MTHSDSDYTPPLGQTLDEDLIGGKGASLARMSTAGFQVPSGFSVTAEAYRRFLEENALVEPIAQIVHGLDPDDLDDAGHRAQRIQQMIAAGHIAQGILDQIGGAYRRLIDDVLSQVPTNPGALVSVSVRSSATAEDLPGASFAGQHDSYLNVRDEQAVVQSVQKCWASLWSAHAIHYRHRLGFDHMRVMMAAVVQVMIPATSSGVMFTVNPVTGDDSEIVVNSCWGLGEAIVSGLVTPDNIVVSKAGREVRSLDVATKEIMVEMADGSGTVQVPVSPERASSPSISGEQIEELAATGQALEEYYGAPQDVEWCFEGGRLYLLQSRPITTL